MAEAAPGITIVDTLLGGEEGITAAYLIASERPALVETGARTSAGAVREALARLGMGAEDLAFLVLTHIHLDHCGAVGLLAREFPRARVVVHRRGARHLASPERLVAASAEVYGERASLYGGLDPVDPERIDAAEDGLRIDLGGGRRLRMIEALGHARHHMAVLDEQTGTVMAGDALGARFAGAGLYPAVPPPDFDLDLTRATLRRLAALRPERICVAHFGTVPDPQEALATAERQASIAAGAAARAWRREGTVTAVARAVEAVLPPERAIGDPATVRRLRDMGWIAANAAGLAHWAERAAAAGETAP